VLPEIQDIVQQSASIGLEAKGWFEAAFKSQKAIVTYYFLLNLIPDIKLLEVLLLISDEDDAFNN